MHACVRMSTPLHSPRIARQASSNCYGARYGTRYGAHLVRHDQPAQVEVVALLGQQVAELPHLNGPTAVALSDPDGGWPEPPRQCQGSGLGGHAWLGCRRAKRFDRAGTPWAAAAR